MIQIRPAAERGRTALDWLDSWHTFSFGEYHDPAWMGFRTLRVINDDRVAPGGGFGTHPHRDMEIITYVVEGALEHRDSLGTGSVIRRGDVQRMSAGTGIRHSEFNPSQSEAVHLLQIWLLPERRGLEPSYEQRSIPDAEKRGQLRLIAARQPGDGALTIHQDVELYAALLEPREQVSYALQPGRHAWLQLARGSVTLNGRRLGGGDGAAASDEPRLDVAAVAPADFLLFDLS